jgi:DNA-binding MarR family transcriptional regulator
MTTTPEDPVTFRVFTEIGIISQLASTAFQRVLPEGMSMAGFSVLNHFVRLNKDGETPTRLARAFQVTKGAMTNTLQRLEALGCVTIEPDPRDGRGKVVRITDAGRRMRENAIRTLRPRMRSVLEFVDFEELSAILPTLAKLRATLDMARDVEP